MAELLTPPAIPFVILSFFSSQPDFAAVIGDISEEFHQRIQSSGPTVAKLWFWRETFRNALALTAREVMRTPIRTIIVALGCLLAVNLVEVLPAHPALQSRFNEPWWALFLFQLITALLFGLAGGRLLRGREWALALIYALGSTCLNEMGVIIWYFPPFFFRVTWLSAWPLVAILGIALRQGAFWLGCLWIRRSRSIQQRRLTRV